MKKFTNKKGGSYLFVEVHEDIYFEPSVVDYGNVIKLHYKKKAKDGKGYKSISKKLSKGNYTIIGLAKDVTEEVAESIVDNTYCSTNGCFLYKNYIENDFDFEFEDLATESLHSLLQSLGLKTDYTLILKLI